MLRLNVYMNSDIERYFFQTTGNIFKPSYSRAINIGKYAFAFSSWLVK